MANTQRPNLTEDAVRRIAQQGENLYSVFRDNLVSSEDLKDILLSLAAAGGGTLLVGVSSEGEVQGVGGHEIDDVTAGLEEAGSVVDFAGPLVNAVNVGDRRWVACVLLGEFQPNARTAKITLQGFDDLSSVQRRLALALERALTSGNYKAEAITTVTHNKGWAIVLSPLNQAEKREILGFGELDLHALADENYIRLLRVGRDYKIGVTQKAGRERRRAIAMLQRAERPDDQMAHVFVSYVREDREAVDRLCEELRGAGLSVWLDRDEIMPGERWKDSIRRAIQGGAYFIACFSGAYHKRERSYMNEELVVAIEELRRRPVDRHWFIPLRLEDCDLPDREIGGGERLNDLQWVDLFRDWDEGIKRLLSALA